MNTTPLTTPTRISNEVICEENAEACLDEEHSEEDDIISPCISPISQWPKQQRIKQSLSAPDGFSVLDSTRSSPLGLSVIHGKRSLPKVGNLLHPSTPIPICMANDSALSSECFGGRRRKISMALTPVPKEILAIMRDHAVPGACPLQQEWPTALFRSRSRHQVNKSR